MKWFAYNAFGAAAWLAGLFVAKNAGTSAGNVYLPSSLPALSLQSQLATGVCLGGLGLALLIWSNIRTQA